MGLFSFFNKKREPTQNSVKPSVEVSYGKKEMRKSADKLLSSRPPNAIAYICNGSGYLYVGTLIYVCRADQKMTANQRSILVEFIRRHSQDESALSEAIENQLRRWITPSRQQFALDLNVIIASGNGDVLRDIHSTSLRLVSELRTISDMQKKAIEKLTNAVG